MTREAQLAFCKICKNQKFDLDQGIICELTNKPAAFEATCATFEEDAELKLKVASGMFERELEGKTASSEKRLANYFIDLIFLLIFNFIFGVFLGLVFFVFAPSAFVIFEQDNILIDYLLGFIAGMIYFTTLEATTGRTIAKYITKTKVVDEKGKKPNFETIVIRSATRFIPFEAFSFLGSEASGWHDRWSKTRVVEV